MQPGLPDGLSTRLGLGLESTQSRHPMENTEKGRVGIPALSHIDHKYIDWDRGFCPDGRYLWLKKDTNPATGNPYGLDQSIDRASEMVRRGLASFVWMETPDAEVRIAQAFLEGVNERLKNTGRCVFAGERHFSQLLQPSMGN